jgi:hypothetical protein
MAVLSNKTKAEKVIDFLEESIGLTMLIAPLLLVLYWSAWLFVKGAYFSFAGLADMGINIKWMQVPWEWVPDPRFLIQFAIGCLEWKYMPFEIYTIPRFPFRWIHKKTGVTKAHLSIWSIAFILDVGTNWGGVRDWLQTQPTAPLFGGIESPHEGIGLFVGTSLVSMLVAYFPERGAHWVIAQFREIGAARYWWGLRAATGVTINRSRP